MNKVEKRIHQLAVITINWRKQDNYTPISYRKCRLEWRKEIKKRKYSEKDLIEKSITDII